MIKSMTLSMVAGIVKVQLTDHPNDELPITGVSIDTRTLRAGDLFVAIKGPRFDGHNYLNQARAAGAVAALTERYISGAALTQIVVANSEQALGLLGAANRNLFNGCLVGVTGSCGKTSVKEMLLAIFSEAGSTLATEGNLNNALGTPLTLLRINESHQFAVVEMGTSSPGEIEYIANMGRPDVSVIVNAAETHLADLKSVEGVAREKGVILDALADDGIAVLNMDDQFYGQWCERVLQKSGRRMISFSARNPDANCFASDITPNAEGTRFTLHIRRQSQQQEQRSLQLSFWGRYQVANACCAAAVALACGLSLDIIARGLENARPYQRRGQRFVHSSGAILIDETYNANPKATLAAVEQLADCGGRTIMVLGDMLDLGDISDERHRDIGRYAKALGIQQFLSFGPSARLASEAFGSGQHFEDKNELIGFLNEQLHDGYNSGVNSENTAVMVKGSRGMKMLDIIQALIGSDYKGDA
ncbi:UDP-N-acetylmuramoyl-tripeptide--D-alanyl-D-alanine ligase [Endozoicomonas sp. SCSIO W0465]|uniref:UDP-N-acetylmuramoyl-tripeptide--D-alanyl-D- alanine ligase n=1 Tax=Endozoicomonas sp. SCSIO W0465 TaxID=2918516 RepID=UPI0020752D11|nr:UDP-N-acetylmuramoyl-tripeptide--D-alanyl-D-alanine ligase [Endozoicomonas sp. SCSIO W0465]USE34880.1 UDP-N-acetylmuramoyl-tripeptide--D-alanyl-D-alanine ligase [Endozoicomonas sp. SCSIO W0465]